MSETNLNITYRGTVYPWHCDHMGHMNVMWYIGKFDEATWVLFNDIGLSHGYLKKSDRGMAAVEQHVSYFRELRAGASVYISSAVNEVKSKLMVFTHEMFNQETHELVARTRLTGVHLDTMKRKSTEFEPSIMMAAMSYSTRHFHPQ